MGGGGKPACAVGGIGVGIGQIWACGVDAVVFVQCKFGVSLPHGGNVAECADDGEVVGAVAAYGGVPLVFLGVWVGGKQ